MKEREWVRKGEGGSKEEKERGRGKEGRGGEESRMMKGRNVMEI